MLLTEAKNNKNKMARWTVEAILSGAEAIKWGYVSRAGPRDNTNHTVLNVQVRTRGPELGCGFHQGADAVPSCIERAPRFATAAHGAPEHHCAAQCHPPPPIA